MPPSLCPSLRCLRISNHPMSTPCIPHKLFRRDRLLLSQNTVPRCCASTRKQEYYSQAIPVERHCPAVEAARVPSGRFRGANAVNQRQQTARLDTCFAIACHTAAQIPLHDAEIRIPCKEKAPVRRRPVAVLPATFARSLCTSASSWRAR